MSEFHAADTAGDSAGRHEADDRAHQYVAGTLPRDEVDAFELHLLACEDCRTAVRAGAATRVALMQLAADTSGPARVARQTRTALDTRARIGARRLGLAVAVAAVVVLFVITRSAPRNAPPGDVTPPQWHPQAVRSGGGAVTDLVDRGMRAYAAGRYADAARLLGEAATTDSSPGVAFYYGATLLIERRQGEAIPTLLRAQHPAGNPFSADATMLAAKAYLQLHRPDSALAALARAPAATSPALRALADSIRMR